MDTEAICTWFRLSKRSGQWGEIYDETCRRVGLNQRPSDQKSSTLPLDYCARQIADKMDKKWLPHGVSKKEIVQ